MGAVLQRQGEEFRVWDKRKGTTYRVRIYTCYRGFMYKRGWHNLMP